MKIYSPDSPSICHDGPISGVATNGTHVATAGYNHQLILWNVADGTPISSAFHDDLINQCHFSPDGKRIATASADGSMRVFSVPGLRITHLYTGHKDDVAQVQFSPCGAFLATCS